MTASALAVAILSCCPSSVSAQLVTTLVNRDGVSLPCVTVGPLAPIAQEYCVKRTLAQGYLLRSELGVTGLTIGREGEQDGRVLAVAPNSPAARAGLATGDCLVSVDGTAIARTPSDVAAQLIFGARGETVRLDLAREGQALNLAFARAPAPAPPDTPRSPSPLIGMHPMVNWEGLFMPCMGAGPLGAAAVAACLSHYRQDGFVRVGALGSTGLNFVDGPAASALVSSVDLGSTGAAAGVRVGDRVTAIDGHPLRASLGRSADALLFGRAGATRRLVVDRGGRKISADLTLTKP